MYSEGSDSLNIVRAESEQMPLEDVVDEFVPIWIQCKSFPKVLEYVVPFITVPVLDCQIVRDFNISHDICVLILSERNQKRIFELMSETEKICAIFAQDELLDNPARMEYLRGRVSDFKKNFYEQWKTYSNFLS